MRAGGVPHSINGSLVEAVWAGSHHSSITLRSMQAAAEHGRTYRRTSACRRSEHATKHSSRNTSKETHAYDCCCALALPVNKPLRRPEPTAPLTQRRSDTSTTASIPFVQASALVNLAKTMGASVTANQTVAQNAAQTCPRAKKSVCISPPGAVKMAATPGGCWYGSVG